MKRMSATKRRILVLKLLGEICKRQGITTMSFERRIGVPHRSFGDDKFLKDKSTLIIMEMFYHLPWLIEITENGFNPGISELIMQREICNIKIKQLVGN